MTGYVLPGTGPFRTRAWSGQRSSTLLESMQRLFSHDKILGYLFRSQGEISFCDVERLLQKSGLKYVQKIEPSNSLDSYVFMISEREFNVGNTQESESFKDMKKIAIKEERALEKRRRDLEEFLARLKKQGVQYQRMDEPEDRKQIYDQWYRFEVQGKAVDLFLLSNRT